MDEDAIQVSPVIFRIVLNEWFKVYILTVIVIWYWSIIFGKLKNFFKELGFNFIRKLLPMFILHLLRIVHFLVCLFFYFSLNTENLHVFVLFFNLKYKNISTLNYHTALESLYVILNLCCYHWWYFYLILAKGDFTKNISQDCFSEIINKSLKWKLLSYVQCPLRM